MHVIWKRPDGFHGANPTDFVIVEVGTRAKIWLHKTDTTHFPFRVAGGWQETEATHKLNTMVNLLRQEDAAWQQTLHKMFDDTMGDDANKFIDDLTRWVQDLSQHLKGDTWELDIMNHTLTEVTTRLLQVKAPFTASTKS